MRPELSGEKNSTFSFNFLPNAYADKNYSLILGDFNCAIQKNLDCNPPQQLDDISVREFQSMLHSVKCDQNYPEKRILHFL
jgi:hypothetical protein